MNFSDRNKILLVRYRSRTVMVIELLSLGLRVTHVAEPKGFIGVSPVFPIPTKGDDRNPDGEKRKNRLYR